MKFNRAGASEKDALLFAEKSEDYMKKQVVMIIAVATVLWFSGPVLSGEAEWNDLCSRVQENIKVGKLPDAEADAKKSLEYAEKTFGPDDAHTVKSLIILGNIHKDQGNFEESNTLLRKALILNEKRVGPDDPEVIESLNSLGSLLQVQNKISEAEPLFRRALDIDEKKPSKNRLPVAEVEESLALLRETRGTLLRLLNYWKRQLWKERKVPVQIRKNLRRA